MALSEDEVRHVAMLARLELSDAEIGELAGQLSQILTWVEQIGEVAAEDVPPTTHPYALTNVARPDELGAHVDREELLAQAPEVEDDQFVVPRIVAGEA